MVTANHNLPTITGNMTADVVRDMNALADATDDAISRVIEQNADERKMYAVAKLPVNQNSLTGQYTNLMLSSITRFYDADFLVWDSVINKLKVTKSGIYEVILSVHFDVNGAGYRFIQPHSDVFASTIISAGSTTPTRMQSRFKGYLTENTALELITQQSSGNSLDILSISSVIVTKVVDV